MSRHIFRGLAALLIAILVTALAAVSVLAAEIRGGDSITIASGEIIDEDLYAAGEYITVDGIVNGDLWAVGGTITINGTVNGSFVAVGQTVSINGEVAHTARAAGATINISGDVGGDLLVGGGETNIASTATIGGDLLLGAGSAHIDGLINGYIKGGGGDVFLSDGVGEDVQIEVDSLTITSTANIQGNLTYTSENEADIQSGAQIMGTITHKMPRVEEADEAGLLPGAVGKLLVFLMALVIGIVIVVIAPRRTASIADSLRDKPWWSLGWGALILVGTPVAAIVVCITIVGIPLGLITLALWGIAIYLSQIPVSLFIGRWIIGRFREVETRAIMVGALAAGLAILSLLRLIPYLGFFIGLAIVLFGMGASFVSFRKQ